jgi:hypothetical protein
MRLLSLALLLLLTFLPSAALSRSSVSSPWGADWVSAAQPDPSAPWTRDLVIDLGDFMPHARNGAHDANSVRNNCSSPDTEDAVCAGDEAVYNDGVGGKNVYLTLSSSAVYTSSTSSVAPNIVITGNDRLNTYLCRRDTTPFPPCAVGISNCHEVGTNYPTFDQRYPFVLANTATGERWPAAATAAVGCTSTGGASVYFTADLGLTTGALSTSYRIAPFLADMVHFSTDGLRYLAQMIARSPLEAFVLPRGDAESRWSNGRAESALGGTDDYAAVGTGSVARVAASATDSRVHASRGFSAELSGRSAATDALSLGGSGGWTSIQGTYSALEMRTDSANRVYLISFTLGADAPGSSGQYKLDLQTYDGSSWTAATYLDGTTDLTAGNGPEWRAEVLEPTAWAVPTKSTNSALISACNTVTAITFGCRKRVLVRLEIEGCQASSEGGTCASHDERAARILVSTTAGTGNIWVDDGFMVRMPERSLLFHSWPSTLSFSVLGDSISVESQSAHFASPATSCAATSAAQGGRTTVAGCQSLPWALRTEFIRQGIQVRSAATDDLGIPGMTFAGAIDAFAPLASLVRGISAAEEIAYHTQGLPFVFVELGANDFNDGKDLSTALADRDRVLSLLRAAGKVPVTIIPYGFAGDSADTCGDSESCGLQTRDFWQAIAGSGR